MIRILRYTEYLYLAVAVVSIYKIITLWSVAQQETYIFIFFAVVSIAMFFVQEEISQTF